MSYAGASNDKTQNVAADPTVVFQTTTVTVMLIDSGGTGIEGGVATYYAGGWRAFGATDATGEAHMELLPKSYKFRMSYTGASSDQTHDAAADPTVVFQTTSVTVQLKAGNGDPLDTGMVKYYAAGWKDFGTTSGGTASKELLPKSYSFRMSYGGASENKTQDVALDPAVIFQTAAGSVEMCYTCAENSPCTPENIAEKGIYHAHCGDPAKFVQCGAFGDCFELPCPAGLIWDQEALTCIWH